MKAFKIKLKGRRLLAGRKLPRIVLPKLWKLPQRVLLRERTLPPIEQILEKLPLPKELLATVEIERIEVMPFKPTHLKIIFSIIPEERRTKQEATP